MRTVSGKVLSSQQFSLSKAAKLISRFTVSDNEAAPAFAAYLRRTCAAFIEVVQLHKEYNISLGKFRAKKDHCCEEVVLPKTEMQSAGEWVKKRDEGTINSVKNNLLDARNDDKKTRGRDQRHGTINGNEMGRLCASEDLTKKKKKKREKDAKENRDGDLMIAKEAQYDGIGGVYTIHNNSDDQSKHKKKSKINEVNVSSCIGSTDQRCESNADCKNDVSNVKKQKKKQRHERKERELHSIETEVTDKKVSRKRKHERVAHVELDGSQEAVKSKKNKYKQSST
ncbi:hypothetical protein RND81_01G115800 [Saponaria officinalis]|uniref:Uncharacterized protein n=1 Tax=Saponaria officinalis TaxID=3572 RepID=A0AAW1N6U5_SAPOF